MTINLLDSLCPQSQKELARRLQLLGDVAQGELGSVVRRMGEEVKIQN